MTYNHYQMQMKETMEQHLGETKVWNTSLNLKNKRMK